MNILDKVTNPKELKNLPQDELNALCKQIRMFLVASLSETGGHLASNLGVVELSVALHRIFNSPIDKILWDVGHQSYTHKILTGRKNMFSKLRHESGISGFPRTEESLHDAFISGHSSTSVSAACGIARAKLLRGEKGKVIAVIGDGAFTGGMAYEAINNVEGLNNLIVILNDNKMSISKNVGTFSHYLADLRTRPKYIKTKSSVETALNRIPVAGKGIKKAILSSKSLIKNIIFDMNFFSSLGFSYFGPVDGHEMKDLLNVLTTAQNLNKPVFIHVNTIKGRGYSFAEKNPGAYHGISRFDIMTGNSGAADSNSYSVEFGKELERLAHEDSSICAITAAMKYGTGLQYFKSSFPERFFDVGIAEQHAVTFSAGLAAGGMKPVFAVYSSFLQRAYDQIIHDASIERRHIVLAVDRAGIIGDDGETHQGIFDVSFLSSIPGVTILSPCGFYELRKCLHDAIYNYSGVVALRYPRGGQKTDFSEYAGDFKYLPSKNAPSIIVTYGRLFEHALEAREILKKQNLNVSILKMTKLFPFDRQLIEIVKGYKYVYFFEEGIKNGGVGENLLVLLYRYGFREHYSLTAVDNEFVPQSSVDSALNNLGMDGKSMARKIINDF